MLSIISKFLLYWLYASLTLSKYANYVASFLTYSLSERVNGGTYAGVLTKPK